MSDVEVCLASPSIKIGGPMLLAIMGGRPVLTRSATMRDVASFEVLDVLIAIRQLFVVLGCLARTFALSLSLSLTVESLFVIVVLLPEILATPYLAILKLLAKRLRGSGTLWGTVTCDLLVLTMKFLQVSPNIGVSPVTAIAKALAALVLNVLVVAIWTVKALSLLGILWTMLLLLSATFPGRLLVVKRTGPFLPLPKNRRRLIVALPLVVGVGKMTLSTGLGGAPLTARAMAVSVVRLRSLAVATMVENAFEIAGMLESMFALDIAILLGSFAVPKATGLLPGLPKMESRLRLKFPLVMAARPRSEELALVLGVWPVAPESRSATLPEVDWLLVLVVAMAIATDVLFAGVAFDIATALGLKATLLGSFAMEHARVPFLGLPKRLVGIVNRMALFGNIL